MTIEIVEESVDMLPEYCHVSIAFRVESHLRVEAIDGCLGGLRFSEERVDQPYIKNYDSGEDSPEKWRNRWHIDHWGSSQLTTGQVVLARQ